MQLFRKFLVAVAAGTAAILNFLVFPGLTILAGGYLGLWSYPAFFGIDIMFALLTLLLVPSGREQLVIRTKSRVFLRIDEARMSHPFWVCIRKRGAFLLVAVGACLIGPVFAALLIRFLQIGERRALFFVIGSTLIETVIRVSILLGVTQTMQDALGHVIAVAG